MKLTEEHRETIGPLLLGDKVVTAVRVGTCDYVKCNSACCRTLELLKLTGTKNDTTHKRGFYEDYGFTIDAVDDGDEYLFDRRGCAQLDETGKCKKYEDRRQSCKLFPLWYDRVYRQVKDVCGYTFEDIKVVALVKKKGKNK